MYIKRIYLENYRNYSKEEFLPEIGLNFIFGKNGQGKTNLIETVYLLSSGKSFRNNNLRELINFDKSYFKVEIDYVYEENIESEIKYFFSLSGKKKVKIDGTEIEKNSDLMENLLVVIFSPEDLKIVKEDPEKRRKFLDREICQINKLYYMNLLNYNKVLKQRNFYLRENKINKSFLDILDEQIINFGKEIIEEREKYLKLLNEESKKINKKITYGREELEIIYLPSVLKESYSEKMHKFRDNDILNRRTSIGPHKDDFKVNIDGINARKYGSQGQQRTAALSIKLSEIEIIKKEKNEYPVLLLDDVFSELDEERQKFLIDYLKKMQVFITSAEKLKHIDRKKEILYIEKGKLKKG